MSKESELLEFVLALSTLGLKSGLADAVKETKEFDTEIKKILKDSKGSFSAIGSTAKTSASHVNQAFTSIRDSVTKDTRQITSQVGKQNSAFASLGVVIEKSLNTSITKMAAAEAQISKSSGVINTNIGAVSDNFKAGQKIAQEYTLELRNMAGAAGMASGALKGLQGRGGATTVAGGGFGTRQTSGFTQLQAGQSFSYGSGGQAQQTIGQGTTSGTRQQSFGYSNQSSAPSRLGLSSFQSYSASQGSGYGMFSAASAPAKMPSPVTDDMLQKTQAMTKYMGDLDQQLEKTAQKFGVIQSLGVRTLVALAIAGGGAVKTFMDYESTLNKFLSVSQATRQELEQFRDVTIDLGSKTQFSAKAVGMAGVELAKLGFTTAESIKILPAVVNAATAAQIELADAAKIVSTALRGFKMDASQTTKVVDLFSVAAAKSAIDFNDIGETFKYVSSVAKGSSQSIEDMTALIAIMGNNMITGSMAGTSLRAAMVRLQRPTEATRDVLETLGIEIGDKMTGKMRRLPEIIKDLQNKMNGLNDTTKNGAVAAIFGQEALSGMMAIINQSPEEIDAMVASMNDVAGAADKMAKDAFQGLSAEFKMLQASMETAAISFGPEFAEGIGPTIAQLREFFKAISDLPSPVRQTIVDFGGFIATTALMMTVLGGARAGIGALADGLLVMIGTERAAKAAMLAKTAATGAATGAQSMYSFALAGTNSKLTAMIFGINGAAMGLKTSLIPALATAGVALGAFVAAAALAYAAVEHFKTNMKDLREQERADEEFNATLQKKTDSVNAFSALQKKVEELKKKALKDAKGNLLSTVEDFAKAGMINPDEVMKAAAGAQNMANQGGRDDLRQTSQNYRDMAAQMKEARLLGTQMLKLQNEWNELRQRAINAETSVDRGNLEAQAAALKVKLDNIMSKAKNNNFIDLKTLDDTAKRQAELEMNLREDIRRGDKGHQKDEVLESLNKELSVVKDTLKTKLSIIDTERDSIKLRKESIKAGQVEKDQATRELLMAKELFLTEMVYKKKNVANNIYEAFLGNQPISHIRGVGGKHAGVDLQAKSDYDKPFGSQVFAPEDVKVKNINTNLDYGAMVTLQSLVDKRVEYVLHHLSPGDVKKNMKVGQEIMAGEKIGARVGGTGEIKPGPHWEGVHLHVEKYVNGVLTSIDNTVNQVVDKKTIDIKSTEANLIKKFRAFLDSDSGLTRAFMESFKSGMSMVQYNDYLNSPDEKGAYPADAIMKKNNLKSDADLQAFMGKVIYKKPGMTNKQMMAELYGITEKEFDRMLTEAIFPDRSSSMNSAKKSTIAGVDFSKDARAAFDFFTQNFSTEMTRNAMPTVQKPNFSESDSLILKNKERNKTIPGLKALLAKYKAGGYEAEAADLEKFIAGIGEDIAAADLESVKKLNEAIEKDTEQLENALKKREDELKQNAENMKRLTESAVKDLEEETKQIQASFAQDTMTAPEKAASMAESSYAKKRKDLELLRAELEKTALSDDERTKRVADLEKAFKTLDEQHSFYLDNVIPREQRLYDLQVERERIAKELADASKLVDKAQSEFNNPLVKMDTGSGAEIGTVRSGRKEVIEARKERVRLLKEELDAFSRLTEAEQKEPAMQKQIGELRKEYADELVYTEGLQSEILDILDEQIEAETELYRGIVNFANGAQLASDVFSTLGDTVKSFSSNSQAGQQLSGIFGSVSSTIDAIGKGSKAISEATTDSDKNLEFLKTIAAVLSALSTLGGLFPDQQEVENERFRYQQSIVNAEVQIEQIRAERRLKTGEIGLEAYYAKMREINKKNTSQTLAQIANEVENESKDMLGIMDYINIFFKGDITNATKIKQIQLAVDAITRARAENEKSIAEDERLQQESQQRQLDATRRTSQMISDTQASVMKHKGTVLEQIEADHQSKLTEIRNRREDLNDQFGRGDITKDEYLAGFRKNWEEEQTLDKDTESSKRDHYATIEDMATDHTRHLIEMGKATLKDRQDLIDKETEAELRTDRKRIKELEDNGRTWSDEYKALKQKEVDVTEAANKRKLDEEKSFNNDVLDLKYQLQEALAQLTATEIDDFAVTRDIKLFELTKWKDDMLAKFPKEAETINSIFVAQSAAAYRGFDDDITDHNARLAASRREMLQLEAEATTDVYDDVLQEYRNSISEIDMEEKAALEGTKLNSDQKIEIEKKSIAKRLIAQQKYFDNLKNMATTELNQAKKMREIMFNIDSEMNRQMISKYEIDLRKIEVQIKEKELAIKKIMDGFKEQRYGIEDKALGMFTTAKAGVDIDAQIREALKFYKVNITGVDSDNAAKTTQTEAMEEWIKYLDQLAMNDFTEKLITEEQLKKKLQSNQAIRGRGALESINAIRAEYNTEIQALIDAGKAQEEIDLTRKKRDKEVEDLRSIHTEAFEAYKQLEIEAIDAKEKADTSGLRKELENLEIKADAVEYNLENEQVQLEQLKIAYDRDMTKIDEAIMKVDQSHQNLAVTLDMVRNNFSGTIDEITKKYENLYATAEKVRGSVGGLAGFDSGSGATTVAGGAPTRKLATGIYTNTAPEGFTVTDGNYWYQNTSDMYLAQRMGLKDGGVMPSLPGYENKDVIGPFMLSPREEVINFESRKSIMSDIKNIPDIVSRAIQNYNYGSSSNVVYMTNHVRDDQDMDRIIDTVYMVIDEKNRKKINNTGYLSR